MTKALTPIYYNKTFNNGNPYLNACVGINGVQDHEKYGVGFDEAAKLLIKAAKKNDLTQDAAIYPLVFCARHRIELFLKDQLMKFSRIRKNDEVTEDLLCNTHDLGKLWDLFKRTAETTDRRLLEFVNEVDKEDCVLDFAEIDPTGETFRYPYDKYKTLHLLDTPLINIGIFEKRYTKFSDMIERFECLTEYLIYEYTQKTYTAELSRDDIYEISKMLPNKEEWKLDTFDKIRSDIRTKYTLSNRKLSEAIDIIKTHREFCINIGIELPIPQLTTDSIDKYVAIYKRMHTSIPGGSNSDDATRKRRQRKARCVKAMKSLPQTAIVCIFTLVELGKLDYFGEEFDFLYEKYSRELEDDYDFTQYCSYITASTKALSFLKKGLEKTGQRSLLKCLATNVGTFKAK